MARTKKDEILTRENKIRDWVENAPLNTKYLLAKVIGEIGYELHLGKKVKPEGSLSMKQVQLSLNSINADPSDLRIVEMHGVTTNLPEIEVRVRDASAFERRLSRARLQKTRLAESFWDFALFQKKTGTYRLVCESGDDKQAGKKIHDSIQKKVLKLKRRSQLYFSVDAGTTMLAMVEELLKVEDLPLVIHLEKDKSQDVESIRQMSPVLLTNSVPIVNAVYGCERLRGKFSTELIGGEMRPRRQCTVGEKSEKWIRMLQGGGDIGVLDLAIVGATGIRFEEGIAFAGCDDQAEARLKIQLLDLAGSHSNDFQRGLRVIVLHSSKLLYPENRCCFSMLTSGAVDLVVTDAGENEEEEAAVEKFCVSLNNQGVAVLVASLDIESKEPRRVAPPQ